MIAKMPAQWTPHERCLMAWPGHAGPWPADMLDDVQRDYAAVAHAIRAFEPVTMVVDPDAVERARDRLGPDIEVLALPTREAWMRDTGPAFVRTTAGLAGACWRFNGWGGASEDYAPDALISRRLCEVLGLPTIASALAFEGGAMEVDGEGTLLTTETVVLNDNRNPGITKVAAEDEFARMLGIERTIWLPGNEYEFGTDGHVDGIARFARPGVVLFEESASDRPELIETTAANRRALEAASDAAGRPLEIVALTDAADHPGAGGADWEACRSYVNYYIANGGVVMPGYGSPRDGAAREAVASAYPDREVVMVDVRHLSDGGGAIHCITQQLPTPTET